MKVLARELNLETLDALTGLEALCLFVGEDERPLKGAAGWVDWRMCGKLSQVLVDGFFEGRLLESLLLPTEGRLEVPRLFAFGCGPGAELTEPRLAEVLEHAGRALRRAGIRSAAVEVPGAGRLTEARRVQLWTETFAAAFGGESAVVLAEKTLLRLFPS